MCCCCLFPTISDDMLWDLVNQNVLNYLHMDSGINVACFIFALYYFLNHPTIILYINKVMFSDSSLFVLGGQT